MASSSIPSPVGASRTEGGDGRKELQQRPPLSLAKEKRLWYALGRFGEHAIRAIAENASGVTSKQHSGITTMKITLRVSFKLQAS